MALCNQIDIHVKRAIAAADLIITNETVIASDVTQPTQLINEANERIAEANTVRTYLLDLYGLV